MKNHMFSIYDSIAEVFNKPFAEVNEAAALRAFTQALTESPHKLDYMLFHIGEYNDNTGILTSYTVPKRIGDMFQSDLKLDSETHITEMVDKS